MSNVWVRKRDFLKTAEQVDCRKVKLELRQSACCFEVRKQK